MNWKQLRDEIYYLDGSLRDIYVHNTTKSDWVKWSAYINENYKVVFFFFDEDGEEQSSNKIDIEKAFNFWNENDEEYPCHVSIFLGDIVIKAYFFGQEEIEN